MARAMAMWSTCWRLKSSRVWMEAWGIIVASHNSLCTNHIMLAGNDEQKKKWVSKLASGEWLGAWGLTEPGVGFGCGWDADDGG